MKQAVINDDLLIRYHLKEASDADMAMVDQWIKLNKENRRRYEQVAFLLDAGKNMGAEKNPLEVATAWMNFKQHQAEHSLPTENGKVFSLKWLQIAAVLVIISGSVWFSYPYLKPKTLPALSEVSVITHNNVKVDTLPDGSLVYLNKNSSIRYAQWFTEHRVISLTGEAFFQVVHNPARPFTVKTGDLVVQDIGTAFNIKTSNEHIEVIVESGVVKVTGKDAQVMLNASEKIRVKAKDKIFKVEKNADLLYRYYRNNEIIANKTPLKRIVLLLNEVYQANIVLRGSTTPEIPITTNFKAESLDNILKVILLTTPELHMTKTGNKIILSN